MHLHFEKSINAKCDCSILSMSWMGKVPEELPEEEGWKLNRTHYYQEGWLATGNLRGIVGVTFTSSHWRKNLNNNNNNGSSSSSSNNNTSNLDLPQRTNYNLRGHRSRITLVQWNEPYQKLASCDSSGIIFVWIKFEGRWSIELINDRSTPVTHFSWSHDGRMALICYRDGFVLVGSVAGQRYWSSMLNLNNYYITCALWSPSDQQVFLGTSNAQVIVMDVVHGIMISQVQMPMDSPILSMTWSCEKFKMEENEEVIIETSSPPSYSNTPSSTHPNSNEADSSSSSAQQPQIKARQLILAIAFQNGLVFLMKNYDDIAPIQIYTGMQQGLMMEWSNSGEILAVVGTRPVEVVNEHGSKIHEYFSSLHFYNHSGARVLNVVIPSTQWPVTAMTWGHNDKRLFVATGQTIHVGWVAKRVASLQLLCRLTIYKALSNESCVSHLPLPLPVRSLITSLHTQTILSILPNGRDLLEFVSHPPYNNVRLHCTMIRHEEIWSQSPGTVYTLYLEYLGGLIPILKGKRTSKIRPHFVIFSPQSSEDGTTLGTIKSKGEQQQQSESHAKSHHHTDTPLLVHKRRDSANYTFQLLSDSSDSEDVELCASPRLQRKRHRARLRERERERQRERELEWERSRFSNLNPGNGGSNGEQQQQPQALPNLTSSTLDLNNLEQFAQPQQLSQQLVYNDVLPESLKLVEVTSNIWGTKFKIHGLESFPSNLGSLSYKTSVLHLQPRQMTCMITELTDDIFLNSSSTSNNDNNNPQSQHNQSISNHHQHQQQLLDEVDDMFSIIVGSTNNSNSITSSTNNYYTTTNSTTGGGSTRDEYHNNMTMRSSRYTKTSCANKDEDVSSYVEFLPLVAEINSTNEISTAVPTTPSTLRRHLVTHAALIERIDDASSSTFVPASNPTICSSPSIPGPSCLLSHRGSVHSSPTRRRISWTKLQQELQPSSSPPAANSSPPLNAGGSFEINSFSSNSNHHHHHQHHVNPNNNRVGCSSAIATNSNATSSPPPVQPIHVRRSISASYLDNVFERTLPVPVDMVSPDMMNPNNSPPKRLVLVKENQVKESEGEGGCDFDEEEHKQEDESATTAITSRTKMMSLYKDCGKSKSLDFADLAKMKQSNSSKQTLGGINNLDLKAKNPNCPNCKFPTNKSLNTGEEHSSPVNNPCSFPTSTNLKSTSTYTKSTTANFPKTPARKLSNAITIPKPSHSQARRDSNEDRIERLAESPPLSSSGPSTTPPSTPPTLSKNNSPLPIQTPKLHRRLSNFLTPILGRRHLFSCGSTNSSEKRKQSGGGGNPNSTCFIPPDSPTHIAKQPTKSTPTTPAANRKYRTAKAHHHNNHHSFGSMASCASPFREFRQYIANSPLLSRRKCNNNNNNNNNNSSGSFRSSSHGGSYRQRHHTIIDSTDEEDDDDGELDEEISSSSPRETNFTFSRSNTTGSSSKRSCVAQFPSCIGSSANPHPPYTQAHHASSSTTSTATFRDLETFQKSQLRQKLRNKKIHNIDNSPGRPKRREFILHNKAPMWNENSQVYQLDFGGRVTQESAKNFQIEFRGKQVMQFGRIDGNAYTLDFQYPFSALQAFGVALANVTQRLK